MSSDAKRLVLARRARFVAAAIAGLSAGCGKDKAATTTVDAGTHAVDAGVDAARAHPCLCVCQPGDPLCSCL